MIGMMSSNVSSNIIEIMHVSSDMIGMMQVSSNLIGMMNVSSNMIGIMHMHLLSDMIGMESCTCHQT